MEIRQAKARIQALMRSKDFKTLEDFWLELLSQPGILADLNPLLELIRPLAETYPDKALLFLTILKEHCQDKNDATKTLAVLKEIATLNTDEKASRQLRKEIADCYRQLYKHCPNLEDFIRQSELLENRPILNACTFLENILALAVGNYVYSDNLGLGRVVAIDWLLDRFTIEFYSGKKVNLSRHQIRPLAKDDFLVLRQISPDLLKAQVKTDPQALFRSLLKSVQKPLRVKEIKEMLSGIVEENDWERFWEKTKRLANNDPNILITTAGERTYAFSPTRIEKSSVNQPKSRIQNPIITEDQINSLNQDEVIQLVAEQKNLTTIKKILKMVRLSRTQDWLEIYSRLFFILKDKRVFMLLASELVNADNKFSKTIFDAYRSYPLQFLWFLESEFSNEFSYKALFSRLLDILASADLRIYWNEALRCLKANNWTVLQKALAEMSALDGQTIGQTIKNLPSLKESDKIEIKKLIETTLSSIEINELSKIPDPNQIIYSTAEGIKKREQELQELLTVAIPQSAKEIGRAREFGDLSENYEYKAAKEKQARLVAKVEALKAELHRTKPINFANVSTDIVGIGTKVTLAELEDSKQLEITILGPYDIDLEKGIISYLAPIAKELLGKKVGDVVTIKSDEQKTKKYRIVNIERAG